MNIISSLPQKAGFTLAELLIALALLGIIAAFTIPKVLQASAEQEKVAKLRETVSTLEQGHYNFKMANNGCTYDKLYYNLEGQLNVVAKGTQGGGEPGYVFEGMVPSHPCIDPVASLMSRTWVQFANGVVVTGLSWSMGNGTLLTSPAGASQSHIICIDINGRGGPNQPGQDVFVGNWHPWGDVDDQLVGDYSPCRDCKDFFWGSAMQPVYDSYPPNTIPAPLNMPEGRVGYWLTR